jgi:hypothetical protein
VEFGWPLQPSNCAALVCDASLGDHTRGRARNVPHIRPRVDGRHESARRNICRHTTWHLRLNRARPADEGNACAIGPMQTSNFWRLTFEAFTLRIYYDDTLCVCGTENLKDSYVRAMQYLADTQCDQRTDDEKAKCLHEIETHVRPHPNAGANHARSSRRALCDNISDDTNLNTLGNTPCGSRLQPISLAAPWGYFIRMRSSMCALRVELT